MTEIVICIMAFGGFVVLACLIYVGRKYSYPQFDSSSWVIGNGGAFGEMGGGGGGGGGGCDGGGSC